MSLFVDVAGGALHEGQIWDLGSLLPALAAAGASVHPMTLQQVTTADPQAAQEPPPSWHMTLTMVKVGILRTLLASSCFTSYDDENPGQMHRLVWVYITVHRFAEISRIHAKAPINPWPPEWQEAARQIALFSTPLAVVGGEIDIEKVDAGALDVDHGMYTN